MRCAGAMTEAKTAGTEAVTIFKRAMRTDEQKRKARADAAARLCDAVRAAATSAGCEPTKDNTIHGPHGHVELSDGGGRPFVVRVLGSTKRGAAMPVDHLIYDEDAEDFVPGEDGKLPATSVAEAVVALFPKQP